MIETMHIARRSTLAAVLIITATAHAGGGEGFSPNPIRPVIPQREESSGMKGATIAFRALEYLKNSQNADGSWGSGANMCKVTSLAYIAFKRCGGPTMAYKETIKKAELWLRDSRPETDEDRLAVVIAVASIYNSSSSPRIPDKGIHLVWKEKANMLLRNISEAKDSAWFDLFSLSTIPEGIERPSWAVYDNKMRAKYLGRDNDLDPNALEGYLDLYLTSVVKRWSKDSKWNEHRDALVKHAASRQKKSGAFPASSDSESSAASSLQALCFSLEGITSHRWFELQPKEGQSVQSPKGKSTATIPKSEWWHVAGDRGRC